jgi:rhodanese-related sulfurtransferase
LCGGSKAGVKTGSILVKAVMSRRIIVIQCPGTENVSVKGSKQQTMLCVGMIMKWRFPMNRWIGVAAVLFFVLSVCIVSTDIWAEQFQQISPEKLKQMIEAKDNSILIIDVQPKGAYDVGHVKGAINLPWDKDIKSPGKLPKNKTLIIYCDCTHEEDSISMAEQLTNKWGYTNIKLLEGGWSKWLSLGYPMEKKKR